MGLLDRLFRGRRQERKSYRLEPAETEEGRGFVLRHPSGRTLGWNEVDDPSLVLFRVAGASHRPGVLNDPAFAPGQPLQLVPNPNGQYIGVWDAEQKLELGHVPRDAAAAVRAALKRPGVLTCFVLWEEVRGEERTGVRALLVQGSVMRG